MSTAFEVLSVNLGGELFVTANDDLSVILNRGAETRRYSNAQQGTVVLSLGVDDDHDEIEVDRNSSGSMLDVLLRASEVLDVAVRALQENDQ